MKVLLALVLGACLWNASLEFECTCHTPAFCESVWNPDSLYIYQAVKLRDILEGSDFQVLESYGRTNVNAFIRVWGARNSCALSPHIWEVGDTAVFISYLLRDLREQHQAPEDYWLFLCDRTLIVEDDSIRGKITETDTIMSQDDFKAFMTSLDSTANCSSITTSVMHDKQDLMLWPIPAKTEISIDVPFRVERWSIYNSWGELVTSRSIDSADNLSISISDHPSGVYILKVGSNDGEYLAKKYVKL